MNNNTRGRRFGCSWYTILIVAVIIIVIFWIASSTGEDAKVLTWEEFDAAVEDAQAHDVTVTQNTTVPTGNVHFYIRNDNGTDEACYLYVSDVNEIQDYLKEHGVDYEMPDISEESWLSWLLPIIIMLVGIFVIFMLMNRQNGNANAQAMDFGRNRARLDEGAQKVTFDDVAGLEEEKEDLSEIVDFLKNPNKYTQLGARIPKGVLLVGPPGTGKTLLAKAVAGEAGVPFYSISGSDFVEMFVGVGASRVRDMFEEAKKNAPCIVFIDEIDAVARRRGTGMGGGHDEREQTLNQLLVEMDGFGVNEGIIVMAATNREDILDPAIMRPGRFDRKITVNPPDVKGREAILKVHARGKPLADDVNLKQIAQSTAGFTGADLENLLNEAAIMAAKENRAYIMQADIQQAFVKVGIGEEKKSRVISEKEKRITAFHESGHAILFHVLPDVGPVYSVSIIPTGSAGGYTMTIPEQDTMFNTRGEMLQTITASLGGRVAEEEVLDDITTGASQDIKQATDLARAMVTRFGMSETIGLVSYDDSSDEVFIGRDMAKAREYGEDTAAIIDKEVRRIIDECYADARRILKEYESVLYASADLLMEKEKITGEEFASLFDADAQEN